MKLGNWIVTKPVVDGRWSKVGLAKAVDQSGPLGAPSTSEDYVIKYVDHHSRNRQFAISMLRRELACSQLASHPNLISFLDSDFQDEVPFLVSPRALGETLFTINEHFQNFLEFGEKLTFFRQISEGIAALHQQNIRHGDLSPGNIIVNLSELRTTIIDLGLAEKVNPFRRPPGYVAGTLGYTAPECQAGFDPITISSDVYSLGKVMQELFGETAFQSNSKGVRHQSVIQLQQLLTSMVERNSLKRPTILEVIDQVSLLEIQCLRVSASRAA